MIADGKRDSPEKLSTVVRKGVSQY